MGKKFDISETLGKFRITLSGLMFEKKGPYLCLF
jgi:hypothetical protein